MERFQGQGGAPRWTAQGFTLIELLVVIGLISMIVGVALPRLMPAILFSNHEGAARRIAGYGRSAIGHAALRHERLTVMVDLDHQEYWCERLPEPKDEEEEDGRSGGMGGMPFPTDGLELLAMAQSALAGEEDGEVDTELLKEQAKRMNDGFERLARRALLARAERVIHDREGLFDEMEPLFEDEFTLDIEEDKDLEPVEVLEPLLQRTRLPQGCFIDSVRVGEKEHRTGVVEIEITTLGLAEPVTFFIANEDGDYFTVDWDPITSDSHLRAGRASVL